MRTVWNVTTLGVSRVRNTDGLLHWGGPHQTYWTNKILIFMYIKGGTSCLNPLSWRILTSPLCITAEALALSEPWVYPSLNGNDTINSSSVNGWENFQKEQVKYALTNHLTKQKWVSIRKCRLGWSWYKMFSQIKLGCCIEGFMKTLILIQPISSDIFKSLR